MRKITFLTMLLLASYGIFSQSTLTIEYYNWSSPTTYCLSPSPIIAGYGTYSDSLSDIFNGKTFYEYNDEYYCIESWADYYYWFTKKYSNQFSDPQLYAFYYWTKDDLGMTSYIASHNYLGNYYPSLINLNFGDLPVKCNRLKTDRYFAQSNNEERRFVKQLNRPRVASQHSVANSQYQATRTKTSETIGKNNTSNNTIYKTNSSAKPRVASRSSSSSKSFSSKAVK